MMLCKWRDVFIVATNDAGDDFVRQTRRKGQVIDLSVSLCVAKYNEHMEGVDRLDQLRSATCGPAFVEVPLLGASQRRPDQRLRVVGRREPPPTGKHSAVRLESLQAEGRP